MDFKVPALLIPLLPLLGFIINGLGFPKLPKVVAGLVGILASFGAFALTLYLFVSFDAVQKGAPVSLIYFDWISIGDFKINFSFLIDHLSLLMMMVVTGVGTLIHIYSYGYMAHDKGFGKFFAFLNLFMFSMLILVLGGNYVITFIGWEGVGLCSFLLIGFWNTNPAYNQAAKKAFVMNRIGDLGFLLGIFIIADVFKTTDYHEVFGLAATGLKPGNEILTWITILLFVGAMGKSAQIPLFTWLPDAMAGPTPVSALIHAATMVTAGIYMVIRSNVLFSMAPFTLEFISWIGIATALLAAFIGVLQNDIKKILAYSTVSQLGYMFLALGVGAYSSSLFHVITHAFFKALLFLGAGSVIHAMHEEQDIRKMGGLKKYIPLTFATFLIGTIAISGIPPFAGFFSKDEILMHVFMKSKVLYGLAVFGSMLTAFYMFRLVFLTFFGPFRGTDHQREKLHESPFVMTFPLIVLALLSICGGFLGVPEALHGNNWLGSYLSQILNLAQSVNPDLFNHHADHSTEFMLMGISTGAAVLSIATAFVMYGSGKNVPETDEAIDQQGNFITKLIYNKFYIDELYEKIIIKPVAWLGSIASNFIEHYVIDLIVNASGGLVVSLGKVARKAQAGSIGVYVFAMVSGIICILLFNLNLLK